MEQNRKYATFGRQVGYIIGANIAVYLLGFIYIPILTKGLGANLYGIWSLINVTISLIIPFAMLTFGMSIVRFLGTEKDMGIIREDILSAYSTVCILGAVFALLLFFLSDILAESIFKDVGSSFYIRLASVLILVDSIRMLTLAFFRMRGKIGLRTILALSYSTFSVGLVIIFIQLDYKLTGLITALIISGILFNLITLSMVLRQTGVQLPRFSRLKSYVKWGVPLIPNTALLWIIHMSDRYLVSYFLGVTAVGIYGAAYAIGGYAALVLAPLTTVLYPNVSKTYGEGNLGETRNYLKYSVKYLMMIAIPSALGLSVLAKPILQVLTTPEFISGYIIVPFVAAGTVLFAFRQVCNHVLYLFDKTYWSLTILVTSAVLNVVLNLILIPRMGVLGAAVATLIAYGVLGILTLMVTRRYLKFDLSLPFIAKSIFSSGIMALSIWLMNPQSIAILIISIFAGVAVYFSVLLLIKGLSKEELAFFATFIKDSMRKIRVRK